MKELFTRKATRRLKINDEGLKASIFALLHEPPADHGINRTTWTMADIRAVLAKQGVLHALVSSGRSPRPPDTNGAKRGACLRRTILNTPKSSPTSV